jgi:phosphatidylglycerol:prolipoprotein diacylglycerol transferase
MYPELFRVGPIVVNSYGLMLALAFIVGILLALKRAEKKNVDGNIIINLSFIIMISAIVGSRLFYVMFHIEEFEGRWQYTFLPIQPDGTIGLGGLVFLGGFIGSIISGAIYVYTKKIPFLKVADVFSPSLGLGLFLGRLGCFFNGCCFGRECHLPWGMIFPANSPAGYQMGEISIHPTQLYSSLYALTIFIVLIQLDKKERFEGFLFSIFLILYGIARFIIDFFRYYESQMFIFDGIDFNQIVSLFMILVGIWIIISQKSKLSKKSTSS